MKILKKDFTFIDLFSGIGGFHHAMKKYSKHAKCVFASEINKNAIKIYQENFNIDSNYDITNFDHNLIPKFDVLCAGFPCQSFSKAGKMMGFNDSRGILFNEIEKILKYQIEKNRKPKIIILENVKSIVTHDNKNTWKTIKQKLEDLGYNMIEKPIVVSPSEFNIPQLRYRAIIVGVSNDIYDGKIAFNINKTNYQETDKITEDFFQQDLSGKYDITEEDRYILDAWDSFMKIIGYKKIGFPIWSFEFGNNDTTDHLPKWKENYVQKNRKLYENNKEEIDKWLADYNIKSFSKTNQKFEWQAADSIDSVYKGYIQFRPSGIRVKKPTDIPTLVAMAHTPIIGKYKRYLTPSEAARLQSFPNDFLFDSVGNDIYRLLGNAVNVDVIYNVFKSFIDFLEREQNDGN